MPNYLTKEEIRQWRSSLEKITLEEFAIRLGKEVEEKKPTNDVVDIVMSQGTSSNTNNNITDGFSKIAERAFERERQISHTPFSISRKELAKGNAETKKGQEKIELQKESSSAKANKTKTTHSKTVGKASEKEINIAKESLKDTLKITNSKKSVLENVEEFSAKKDIQIVLKKSLTDREQLVFEYLLNNAGKTVYAKDLAQLLELPRDYIYKYIKNLRAKIDGDNLKNVPSGGFVLTL